MKYTRIFFFVITLITLNMKVQAKSLKNESATMFSVDCKKLNKDACKLECYVKGDERAALIQELEQHYIECGKPMELALKGTPFPEQAMFRKADLNGAFKLSSLKIEFCDRFSRIEDNAFDKPALNDLTTLSIMQSEGEGIELMNEKTFAGLNALKSFNFKNTVAREQFKGEGVLKPLSETLEFVKFEQTSIRELPYGYEPGVWFKGANYTKLKEVDLRNNYFPGKFKADNFEGLNNVERLHLAGNAIDYIEDLTFLPMNNTWKYLDLSDNNLKTLSSTILFDLSANFVQLKLIGNEWKCTCDNLKFMEYCQADKLNYLEQPVCKTPLMWEGQDAADVDLYCDDNDSTTTDFTTDDTTIITTDGTEVEESTIDKNLWVVLG